MNILAGIQRFLVIIFLYIFRMTSFAIRRLRLVGSGIRVEDKVSDFFQIFKSTRIFFLFNLLALLVFTLLPQGKDIILIVIEDLSKWKIWSTISLLAGLLGWCIISEFGARYKIYITDNSGVSLTDERVNFRKEAQRFVSSIYLLLPVVIMMISVIIVSLANIRKWEMHDILPFAVVLFLLILGFALLSRFYLDSFYIEKLRKNNVWYKVRDVELKWAGKLYGIYNDYIFRIPKEANFKDDYTLPDSKAVALDPPPDMQIKNAYRRFIDLILLLPRKSKENEVHALEDFPGDYINEKSQAPIEFREVTFHSDSDRFGFNPETKEFERIKNEGGYYRWVYKNNPSFYRTLHLQVHVIAISSLVFLLLISTRFLISYEMIGSPALVCLSFACWLGVYTGLLYIDSRFKRKIKVSVRWILLFWFFIVSFINKDHPVRKNGDVGFTTARPTLGEHFNAWAGAHLADTFIQHKTDTFLISIKSNCPDSVAGKPDSLRKPVIIKTDSAYYPVYFITAEGGALRTGAFTALFLAALQDADSNFKKHIYAFSTVSGGSVGVSFFNAISYLEPNEAIRSADYYESVTRNFFAQDQLSPVLAKLFYADLINDFWPAPIENFDRAIALEKAWERSYANTFGRTEDKNVFSSNFLSCYSNAFVNQQKLPAWFINTTEVESGLQCYISNVRADKFILSRQRDLLAEKIRYGINYSTAVNFSSRFPLFSPSAALCQNDDQTFHYVDGGYVENTGSKTMLEVLQSLHDSIRAKRIRPYVIQLRFSESDSAKMAKTGFLNEIASVLAGIYNTRAGSSGTYSELLKKEVAALNGELIKIPLSAHDQDVPMSWVFSRRSLNNLDAAIKKIMSEKGNELHRKMPWLFEAKK